MVMTLNSTRLSLKAVKHGFTAAIVVVGFITFQSENQVLASGVWELAQEAQFGEGVMSNGSFFSEVSCSSPGNCTAVGWFEYQIDGQEDLASEAITMTSNDGEWDTAQPAQFEEGIQAAETSATFSSVSCPTDGNCTAVGSFKNSAGHHEAFTMTSNDGQWDTAQPAQFEEGIQSDWPDAWFGSVSCTSPGNCTAVGSFTNSAGRNEAFTMTSNDGQWDTAQPAQFEEGIQSDQPDAVLNSVSCESPGNCTAVGNFKNSAGHSDAFTMTSDDGDWDAARPAQFEEGILYEEPLAVFNSVSCASARNCTAVGWFWNSDYRTEAFTMTSIDGEWETARPAQFGEGVQSDSPRTLFTSVSCASPGNCTAVGEFRNSEDLARAFTMQLTNGEWELAQPAQFEEGIEVNDEDGQGRGTFFSAVSCSSAGNCTAVGYFTNGSGLDVAFTMTSTDGEWELAQPAQFEEATQSEHSEFTSVSCVSPGNCTAVGFVVSPSDGQENPAFVAITMTSTKPPSDEPGLARPAKFNEGVQSVNAKFSSVSCASPGNCTAVGWFEYQIDGQEDPAREAFTMTSIDGEWETSQPAQFDEGVQHGYPSARLNSVSCASPGNCTAVGSFSNSAGHTEAFTMTSNDGEWEQARPAQFGEGIQSDRPDAVLNSVSCASPGNCTAVGNFKNNADHYEAFTMTSNDGEWEQARPAQFAAGINHESRGDYFTSVSCPTSRNCTAVGWFGNSAGHTEAFTMTSNDGEWEQARPAEFAAGIQHQLRLGAFYSVSCASAGNCTAVGHFMNSYGYYEAFTMTSITGEWETAKPQVFPDGIQYKSEPDASLSSVSCVLPGNCTAVGKFRNRSTNDAAFTMTSVDSRYSSQSSSGSSSTTAAPTTTAPTPTPTPTPTATAPTTTAPTTTAPMPSSTTTQPKRVIKRNTQTVAPAVPANNTSTTTTILEVVAQTTLAPEPQTPINAQPGYGSLGWWILGGSSIISGSFIFSAWWITNALRRFQITELRRTGMNIH